MRKENIDRECGYCGVFKKITKYRDAYSKDCDKCVADIDDDCIVGVSDLLILLSNWG